MQLNNIPYLFYSYPRPGMFMKISWLKSLTSQIEKEPLPVVEIPHILYMSRNESIYKYSGPIIAFQSIHAGILYINI